MVILSYLQWNMDIVRLFVATGTMHKNKISGL